MYTKMWTIFLFIGAANAGPITVSDEEMTWVEAQSWCESQNLQMLSIHNDDDQTAAEAACPTTNNCWLGLYCDENAQSHCKSTDDWQWADGSSFGYANWKPGQPNNYKGRQDCVWMKGGESWLWVDFACDAFVSESGKLTRREALAMCYDPEATKPLVDRGNPSSSPNCDCLDECQGDCDGDDDCIGDLVCYHRTNDGISNIPPGCSGEAHAKSHDYCYDPNWNTKPLVDQGNPSSSPNCDCLDECEGDCDGDGDCIGDLVCYHRTNDGTSNIPPGCSGEAHAKSHDYCYDPNWNSVQEPTVDPTSDPTSDPTTEPTIDPTADPTSDPTVDPTADPTSDPTADPTVDPTTEPTIDPTVDPTVDPTTEPTIDPTVDPTIDPTTEPTIEPTMDPTIDPTIDPTVDPTSIFEEDNDGFVLIERHLDVADGYFSSDSVITGVENADDPSQNTFCIIGELDQSEFQQIDGYYDLKLIYRNYDVEHPEDVLEWRQNWWLTESATGGDVDLSNINDSYENNKGKAFRGLARSSRDKSYLDGSPDHSNWWHAVASNKDHKGGIPAHESRIAFSSELWIRPGATESNPAPGPALRSHRASITEPMKIVSPTNANGAESASSLSTVLVSCVGAGAAIVIAVLLFRQRMRQNAAMKPAQEEHVPEVSVSAVPETTITEMEVAIEMEAKQETV